MFHGTPFWRTFRAALLAAGWNLDVFSDQLEHDEAHLTVRRLSGKAVRVLKECGCGPVCSSRLVNDEYAALDVAAQVNELVLRARTNSQEEA